MPPAPLTPPLLARFERAQAACEAAIQRAAGMEVFVIGPPDSPLGSCWRGPRPNPDLDRCSGLVGPLDPADAPALLDQIETFLGAPTLELSPAVPPALASLLGPRGYRPRSTNHLLWRALPPARSGNPDDLPAVALPPGAPDDLPAVALPPGAEIRAVDADPAEALRWSRLLTAAHLGLDGWQGPLPRLLPPAAPGVQSYWIFVNGSPVGGGSLGISDGIAVLFGDALLPSARGRRLQRALIAHRLRLARDSGLSYACAVTDANTASQRNCEACGLAVGYPRLTLSRPPKAP